MKSIIKLSLLLTIITTVLADTSPCTNGSKTLWKCCESVLDAKDPSTAEDIGADPGTLTGQVGVSCVEGGNGTQCDDIALCCEQNQPYESKGYDINCEAPPPAL